MHRVFGLLVILGVAGCGGPPPMVPCSGIVTFNGQPVEHCQVCFLPDRDDVNPLEHGYGMAVTDATGRYTLQNAECKAGIFPGRYRVVLALYHENRTGKPMPINMKPSEVPGGVINVIPVEYTQPETTPEVVEVPRKGLEKNFDIVTKK
jgi:hypothetical protein